MSIQATTRATALPPVAQAPAAAEASAAAARSAPAGAPTAPPPHLERVQLHPTEKVDLGFRADEMRENLKQAVGRLNEQMQRNGRDLSFSLDEKIDRPIITVKNLQTGEVVRQIPTEEVVRLAHSIEDMKGLLFNQTL
ncbi:MAG: hypothetical protein RI884_1586 [Pseudomonadota bacterium]